MNITTSRNRARPMLSGGLLLAAAFGAFAVPAAAEEGVRIPVARADLSDPAAIARVRLQIAQAASALCDGGGIASIYRSGAARCREQAIAEGERQLGARIAAHAGAGGGQRVR